MFLSRTHPRPAGCWLHQELGLARARMLADRCDASARPALGLVLNLPRFRPKVTGRVRAGGPGRHDPGNMHAATGQQPTANRGGGAWHLYHLYVAVDGRRARCRRAVRPSPVRFLPCRALLDWMARVAASRCQVHRRNCDMLATACNVICPAEITKYWWYLLTINAVAKCNTLSARS